MIGGVRPLSLMLILAIIVVLFGTSRVKTIGQDLGEAVRSFRKGFDDPDQKDKEKDKDSA